MPKIGKHSKLLLPEILILIVIIFLAGLAIGFFGARVKYKADLAQTTLVAKINSDKLNMFNQMMAMKEMEGGVVMKNDQMYVVKDDVLVKMDKKYILKDGTKVNVDGGAVRINGAEFKLGNGLGIDEDGQVRIVFSTK